MSQSKPDNIGKNASMSTCDFAMHFRTKDGKLTEVYLNESRNDTLDNDCEKGSEQSMAPDATAPSNDGEMSDSDAKPEKVTSAADKSGSHSPNSSDYKKMFKNLNEFTEKITRTVEEKISEIKSDLGSSRSRILSSKDSSSLSDSEDNSEASRKSDVKNTDDFIQKSMSLDIIANNNDSIKVESDVEYFEGNQLRQRKKTGLPELMKVSEEPGPRARFDDNIEIESAIEAREYTNVEESDEEGQFFDAVDTTRAAEDSDGAPPSEGEAFKIFQFIVATENKVMEGYVVFIALCLFILPLPSFIRGFLTCLFIVVFWRLVNDYMKGIGSSHSFVPNKPFAIPDYSDFPPLKVPQIPKENGVWFNEYTQPYDPDWYSVSQTVPVYLEIENSYLKLSRPKGKISRRATCDEKKYKLEFINRRVYDLRFCRIGLRPEGILRRRYFSKKYPIFIELGPGSFVKAVRFKESTLEEEEIDVESTYKFSDVGGTKSSYGKEYLNLFARCNRQKEEWFRRLKTATKVRPEKANEEDDASTPFEQISFDTEMAEYDEYWQYMSKFVGEVHFDTPVLKTYLLYKTKSGRKKKKDYIGNFVPDNIPRDLRKKLLMTLHRQSTTKTTVAVEEEMDGDAVIKSALEVQWLNAFINRFLFDVFRTPDWLAKIQAKVQRKLASIRLPYYIEALEVEELDLGKVGPRFHRISSPVLDERGIWVDMDMTFDGSFKMILQTQLNLLKLQKGLEEEVAKLPDDKQDSRSVEHKKPERETVNGAREESNDQESSKELLMEFAEIVVADDTTSGKERSSINAADLDNSDSTESDEDDDDEADATSHVEPLNQHDTVAEPRKPVRRSSKRIFRVMESVAQSKYFKSIAETKYVQKAIAGVSATKLRLILEVKSCIGTLSLNVPPPPNDRIWYGFRTVPKIWMSAQPKVGQRNIRFYHIKHFVERKIMDEIKKIIVMPNMDDLLIPVAIDDFMSKMGCTTGPEFKIS